ncbi:MAG: MBL fold metallo-hydrolase [Lysobacterales bacterium]
MPNRIRLVALCLCLLAGLARAGCGSEGVAVQVLGSGGPIADDGRAGSAYLVWVDGHARVLIDAGGGAFLRFGESAARIEDLELIALTHLHADHAADLPALVKSGYFSARERPLPISGPDGGGDFPGLREWLGSQFDANTGAWRYLSGALNGSAGQFALIPQQVAAASRRAATVLKSGDLLVEAIGVPHGPVPALAYRVSVRGQRLVFGGDQNGSADRFWKFAHAADLLVMALAIPEQADSVARRLHAPPGIIGAGAGGAGVRRLLLSHLMERSLYSLAANLAAVRRGYAGSVAVAQDLACYAGP